MTTERIKETNRKTFTATITQAKMKPRLAIPDDEDAPRYYVQLQLSTGAFTVIASKQATEALLSQVPNELRAQVTDMRGRIMPDRVQRFCNQLMNLHVPLEWVWWPQLGPELGQLNYNVAPTLWLTVP